jgi:MFS transporter, DHA3 family, macrolide efflux protein
LGNQKKIYRSLFKNKILMLLWSGQTVSIMGDAFYYLAVMWLVYDQSRSVFLSALVGVMFHLSSAILSPFAGVLADRYDRKRLMIMTHILSALAVFAVGVVYFILGYLPMVIAFITIVLLNGLSTFLYPAESSILPDIVGKESLSGAYGVFQTIAQSASLVGNAIAGLAIAAIGTGWALSIDGFSFIVVAFLIAIARIPKRKSTPVVNSNEKRPNMFREMADGWRYIKGLPVIRSLVWLTLLINIPSFIGPLYPPLVENQLDSGAAVFGFLEVAGIIGGMLGGLAAGFFERRFGAGVLMGVFWMLTGFCTIGIGISTSVPLTMGLMFLRTLFITMAGVCIFAVEMAIISENFRGRVNGIRRSFAVIAIPVSTLIAGGLGEILDISVLFSISGVWTMGVGVLALANSNVRKAKVETDPLQMDA